MACWLELPSSRFQAWKLSVIEKGIEGNLLILDLGSASVKQTIIIIQSKMEFLETRSLFSLEKRIPTFRVIGRNLTFPQTGFNFGGKNCKIKAN